MFPLKKIIQKAIPVFSAPNFLYSTALNSAFNEGYITPEKNPANHTKNEMGLVYTLPNSISLDTLFKGKIFYRDYKETCITFDETHFIIRKPAMEIINCLKNTNFDAPVNKYVLYGKLGSGKTITMCHIIHYAFMEKWLIIHVPKILDWLESFREIVESSTSENCVDLPADASAWLIHFKNQNEELIKSLDLKIENDYKWNIREENKKGESLLNLVNHGISRAKYSCDVINALFTEIKLLSKSGKVKTLVAIDGYNLIFQSKTKIKNIDKNLVAPEQITCIKAFKNLAQSDWNNGAVLLTCETPRSSNNFEDYFPMKLLGTTGFEFLDPFIPIEISPLTDKEMISILNYYRSKKWLLYSEKDEELKFLSAGNPLTLSRLCGPL